MAITGGREEDHIRAGGWYSHSVLVTVLRNTAPAQWKLLFNRLGEGDYHAVLADELVIGALVNQSCQVKSSPFVAKKSVVEALW